jgi:hypothetical protein
MRKCEVWLLQSQLPTGLWNSGRFVAHLLKHLLRTWGVRCVAIRDPETPMPLCSRCRSALPSKATFDDEKVAA